MFANVFCHEGSKAQRSTKKKQSLFFSGVSGTGRCLASHLYASFARDVAGKYNKNKIRVNPFNPGPRKNRGRLPAFLSLFFAKQNIYTLTKIIFYTNHHHCFPVFAEASLWYK
jgi:hypothetical protein